jgi:hypothetical protein
MPCRCQALTTYPSVVSDLVLCFTYDWTRTSSMSRMPTRHPHQCHADAEPWQLYPSVVSDLVLCYTTRTEHLPCQGCRHPHPMPCTIFSGRVATGDIWSLAASIPSLAVEPVNITKTVLTTVAICTKMDPPSENENFSCCQLFVEKACTGALGLNFFLYYDVHL